MRGEVRALGLRLLADGEAVPGVIAADVWSNNHLAADRFCVRLAAGAGGLDQANAPGTRFAVDVGMDGDWARLVVGEADSVSLDPLRGMIEVEGRDLSALFVDSRVDETFANRTSSEIAAELAGRHGLGVDATETGTLVGRYYQSEHGRLTLGQFSKAMSEWDLLAYLAGREGFELFMAGEVLRFGMPTRDSAFELSPGDCTSLQLQRGLAMAREIEVTVRSWDQRGGAAVEATVRGGGGGRSWKHQVVRPNLPAAEAQLVAERALADLMRHEWTAHATMPGELQITPRHQVVLTGTDSAWDRRYAVDEVSRHLDERHGFMQTISLQGVV